MKVAALLCLLAALPGHAADPVTATQARANVVQALPPGIREGAEKGDLRAYLERLTPEQKQAALRSLTAKKDELGDDPKTQSIVGEAYVALGKVKEARQIAQAAIDRNANDPDARRLMGLVITQEKLQRPDAAGGAFGDRGGPGGGGQSASAGPAADLERRIQGVFRRGQRSNEFNSTMQDARGMSVAELRQAGIEFQSAKPDQRDAVMITKTETKEGDRFTISIRNDALNSGGDTEARGAAQVANGVRQAQTLRDHEYIGWALIKARGWLSGARTHQELAPNDIDKAPSTPSDQNLMIQRKLLSVKEAPLPEQPSTYGDTTVNSIVQMTAITGKSRELEQIFEYFIQSTKRAGAN